MYVYTVTFENDYGEERVLNEIINKNSVTAHHRAWQIIQKFCDDHSYKIPYTITSWIEKRGVKNVERIDVGSWTEFFYIYPAERDVVDQDIQKGNKE